MVHYVKCIDGPLCQMYGWSTCQIPLYSQYIVNTGYMYILVVYSNEEQLINMISLYIANFTDSY